jgi:3-keto-5-aminohexanoate cleavage enzyme
VSADPLIIAVAPNGARKTKADHPQLPLTPSEIADAARRCLDAGASMIHLHVRDSRGMHSLEADHYLAAVAAVRRAVGVELVIQVTSESAGVYRADQQIGHMMKVRPESISLALREYTDGTRDVGRIAGFLQWLVETEAVPQYILYSDADLQLYKNLKSSGVVPANPHWLLFVLGRYETGFSPSPVSLLPFLADAEATVPWAVCAFGPEELRSGACAAALGGHARVGFENNLFLKNGQRAASNDQLVAQMAEVAAAIGRPLANADEVRRMFLND